MLHFEVVDRETATTALGALMFVGDYGGFTYLMCRAADVSAAPETLQQLLVDLDAIFVAPRTPYPEATALRWVVTNPWHEWGWKGGLSGDGFWLHERLASRGVSMMEVKEVLSAKAPRLRPAD
jgi:hypothetical protein